MKTRLNHRLGDLLEAREKPGCSRGVAAFTIVEVVAAVFIAAIAFAALFSAINNGTLLLQNTRENLRATQIIQSRIEGMRLIAWGSSTNQLFNTNYFPTRFTESFYPLGLSGSTNQGAIYYGTITFQTPVTNMNVSYSTNIATATITLRWTNNSHGNLTAHSRSISTLVAQYGLQNYVWNATNNF